LIVADTPSGFAAAAANIRDTGKWMLAAFAAIGTVLIAGVQFSRVAKLGPGERELALGLGALGLLALGWAITGLANILLPRSYTMRQLAVGTTEIDRKICAALNGRSELLAGYGNVKALADALDAAISDASRARQAWHAAAPEGKEAALRELQAAESLVGYVSDVTANAGDWANYLGLRTDYSSAVRWRMLPGILVAVVSFAGVILLTSAGSGSSAAISLSKVSVPAGASFAKAHLAGVDLSEAQLGGVDLSLADLSGANLSKAVLSGANFTGANLRGANLEGAALDGVIWSRTICPDGENSTDVGDSCDAHLTVPNTSPD
jgi:hypothetical protein